MSSPLPINPSLVKFLNNVSIQDPNGEFPFSDGNIEEVVLSNIKPFKTKMADVILPTESLKDIKTPEIGDNIKLNNYSQIYYSAEERARAAKFADPLTLNFKLILDFDRKSGLLADESNVDSALAFLIRIGETDRANMLRHWIKLFKTIVKDYDFLFMDVDGLQEVQFNHPTKFYFDQFKLKFTVRETLDLMFQSLITTYKDICYDNIRGVTVLPSNLMKFDCYVVVYSAGYYNVLFHDFDSNSADDSELRVLPTKKKLSDEHFSLDSIGSFNHMLYQFVSCKFDFESGQDFLSTVSNDMSAETTKNNITLTYKFANTSGTFNNITGSDNFFNVLALAAAENKLNNSMKLGSNNALSEYGAVGENDTPISGNPFNPNSDSKFWNNKIVKGVLGNTNIDEQIASGFKQFSDPNTYKNMWKSIKDNTMSKVEDRLMNQIPTKIMGPHSVIGKIFDGLNADNVTNIIQNTIDTGLNRLDDQFVSPNITRLNNILFDNYSDDLVDLYNNTIKNKTGTGIEVIEQEIKPPYPLVETNYNILDTYVRPNNPSESNDNTKFKSDKINPEVKNSKQKFISGTKGLTFFGDKDEVFEKRNNNIYIRKTF